MTQPRRARSALIAVAAVIAAAGPLLPAGAEASEVVKLARLVITGKRLSAEAASLAHAGPPSAAQPLAQAVAPTPPQQLPRVLVEGRRSDPAPQVIAGRRPVFRLL